MAKFYLQEIIIEDRISYEQVENYTDATDDLK